MANYTETKNKKYAHGGNVSIHKTHESQTHGIKKSAKLARCWQVEQNNWNNPFITEEDIQSVNCKPSKQKQQRGKSLAEKTSSGELKKVVQNKRIEAIRRASSAQKIESILDVDSNETVPSKMNSLVIGNEKTYNIQKSQLEDIDSVILDLEKDFETIKTMIDTELEREYQGKLTIDDARNLFESNKKEAEELGSEEYQNFYEKHKPLANLYILKEGFEEFLPRAYQAREEYCIAAFLDGNDSLLSNDDKTL